MKRNIGKKVVTQSIAFAMAAMMATSSVLPVFAEEPNKGNNESVNDHNYDYVDEDEPEYTNDETSGNADAAQMQEDAADAKEAADAAADLLGSPSTETEAAKGVYKDVEDAVAAVDKAVEGVKDAEGNPVDPITGLGTLAGDAQTAAGEVVKDVTDASNEIKEITDEAVAGAESFNQTVAKDQAAIDKEKEEIDTTVPATDENGNDTKIEIEDFVAEKADEAEAAKDLAYDKLGETIEEAKKSDVVTPEVLAKVDEVRAAAATATGAATAAKVQYDKVKEDADDAITTYNKYAMSYGLPLYTGTTDIEYTDEQKAAIETKKAEVEAQQKVYNEKKAAIENDATLTDDEKAVEIGKLTPVETVTVSYTEDQLNKLGLTSDPEKVSDKLTLAATVNAVIVQDKIDTVLDKDLTQLEKDIADKTTAVNTAAGKVEAADQAAQDANKAVDKAVNGYIDENGDYVPGIGAFSQAASTSAGLVAEHYVTPAKEAVDAAKGEVPALDTAIQTAKDNQTAIDTEKDALISQKEEEEKTLQTTIQTVKNAKDTVEDLTYKGITGWIPSKLEIAEETIEDGLGYFINVLFVGKVWVGNTQYDLDKANAVKKKYEDANDIITNNKSLTELENEKNAATSAIQEAKQAKEDAAAAVEAANEAKRVKVEEEIPQLEAVLKAAEETRDKYLEAAKDAYEKDAQKATLGAIKELIQANSNGINQVEFDQDLNAWANTTFDKYEDVDWNWDWETVEQIYATYSDSKDIRTDMDKTYDVGKAQQIFNRLGLSQWAVSTEKTDELMNAIVTAYRSNLKTYEEKMATVESYFASADASADFEAAKAQVALLKPYVDAAAAAKVTTDAAKGTLADAQEAYKNAADDLAAAKAKVENLKLDAIKLADLQATIDAAEAKLAKAADKLKEAAASAKVAETYSRWAENLVNEQVATAFAQKAEAGIAMGDKYFTEYDQTDGTVISRPTANFVMISDGKMSIEIPYTMYRQYVEALYNGVTAPAGTPKVTEKNGSGIAYNVDPTVTGATMSPVYWVAVLDENGNYVLTGDKYLSTEGMPNGTYFIAYTLKRESDIGTVGYHLDGFVFNYTRPTVPTQPTEPGEGGGNDNYNPDLDGPAMTGGFTTAEVLGATRTATTPAEGMVLGANREGAVLGAVKTGDDTNALPFVLAMAGAAAVGAGCVVTSRKKKED
ncbi:MAG: hypothetical protein PHP50_00750 [Lachnospiraceae bacterium]|nr:hypothetical protein [Lachnospiraceae bacterium]